jgi:hypothetical protein
MLKQKQKIFHYVFLLKVGFFLKIKPKMLYTSIFNKNCSAYLNTFFFKKLAFIGLAINGINFKKYYVTTIKSTMFSVWSSVNTYTYIF